MPAIASLPSVTPRRILTFRFPGILLLIVCGFASSGLWAQVVDENTREYQLKSAFIYNFTKFIEWPSDHFEREESPLVIGVFGRNPFGDQLEETVRGRTVSGRGFDVRVVDTMGEALEVDMLFVPTGETRVTARDLERLHEEGVLTVGESPEFRSLGGIITFTLRTGRVRFSINRTAAQPTGIYFSSQLLQLALAAE